MSNPDSVTLKGLERDLQTALRWQPSAAAARRMDDRVAQIAAAPRTARLGRSVGA